MPDFRGFFSLEQDRQWPNQFTWFTICQKPSILPPHLHVRGCGFAAALLSYAKVGTLTKSLTWELGPPDWSSLELLQGYWEEKEGKKEKRRGKRNKTTIPNYFLFPPEPVPGPAIFTSRSCAAKALHPACHLAGNTVQDQKQGFLNLDPHRELRYRSVLSLGLLSSSVLGFTALCLWVAWNCISW